MPPALGNPKAKSAAATQEFLPIATVRDGVVVLKGGEGLRAVLMVSSLNFALKSGEEQDALVFQFENFLNALDFPLQFVVQSRRLNINPYLETLTARQKEEPSELLKVQIGEYVEFVKSFVELTSIVTKAFFAIVPFTPSIAEGKGGLLAGLGSLLPGRSKPPAEAGGSAFAQWRAQLAQRTDAVAAGLRRLDLRVAALNTEELVELFYGLYNPAESQRIRERPPAGEL